MKTIAIVIVIIASTFIGCAYNCEANQRPHCADLTYPAGPVTGPCNTSHTRWFYIPGNDQCELRTYWGCYGYGFSNKDDCEKCRCYEE